MTTSEDAPRRLTKGRAKAMLEIYRTGLLAERNQLEREYGIMFNRDGTVELPDDPELMVPGELDGLPEALERLADATAAAQIIRRRYT